jgi:hypothetical protein
MMPRFLLPLLPASLLLGCLSLGVASAVELAQPTAVSTDGGPADQASSRCTVRREQNGWWFVAPTGEPFFSLGVSMFNQGTSPADYNPDKPSYAALRHYGSPDDWAAVSLRRLKSWGFTTIGGWSDYETLSRSPEHDLWITPVLHLGSNSGVPWFDMWDEMNIRRIDEVAADYMQTVRNDPRVLGYYSDNEIGWWNAILWKMTLEQPASSGQRQRLVRLVRDAYDGDWNGLVRDFEPQSAASWAELDRGGMLWLRPGSDGIRTIRRFLGLAAERYYELMRAAIRKVDPDALYLGDRYQSFYYPQLAAASRAHVDVVSTNLNVSWNDGTFVDSYLDTLHELTGKPLLVSEFYMAAQENRSNNKNEVGGFPIVTTQAERADALANTLRRLARLPYVVGADWFQYYDEPPHGRTLDGEDYNFGLVDIEDQPYQEVTAAFAAIELSDFKSAAAPASPNATAGVPPAPADPFADFRWMTALKNWDRVRGCVPAATPRPVGDLYICWSPTALYLGTFVIDIVEADYYRDGRIPDADRALWTIQWNGGEPVTIRLGAGNKPVPSGPTLRIESLSGLYHNVRCITAVEFPASHFGKARWQPGDRITLESTFTTHGRADRMEWRGTFVLCE